VDSLLLLEGGGAGPAGEDGVGANVAVGSVTLTGTGDPQAVDTVAGTVTVSVSGAILSFG
jgi:hypothetical protein